MNILLLGAPGSGKSLQSIFIKNIFETKNISLGDLLREEINNKTALGNIIKDKINNGILIDDNIVFDIFKSVIDFKNNFLLDGFPRTVSQALFLYDIKFKIDYVIKMDISDIILLKRIKYRLICSNSKISYNILYNIPKLKYKDDISGGNLLSRVDDKFFIFKNRLIDYNIKTSKLINFFINRGIKIINVNANDKPDKIFENIKNKIYCYEKFK